MHRPPSVGTDTGHSADRCCLAYTERVLSPLPAARLATDNPGAGLDRRREGRRAAPRRVELVGPRAPPHADPLSGHIMLSSNPDGVADTWDACCAIACVARGHIRARGGGGQQGEHGRRCGGASGALFGLRQQQGNAAEDEGQLSRVLSKRGIVQCARWAAWAQGNPLHRRGQTQCHLAHLPGGVVRRARFAGLALARCLVRAAAAAPAAAGRGGHLGRCALVGRLRDGAHLDAAGAADGGRRPGSGAPASRGAP